MHPRIQTILEAATEDIMGVNVVNQRLFAELLIKECAGIASLFSVEQKQIHPDIAWEDMPSALKLAVHTTCQQVAGEIIQEFGMGREDE